jgi:hypothetical protein
MLGNLFHMADQEKNEDNLNATEVEANFLANYTHKFSNVKENKTLACTLNHQDSDILTFYVSQLEGGILSDLTKKRDKCMRSQLDQHCMPFEVFPVTVIEQCADQPMDWACANKRILEDHANCLTKAVDWEALTWHAKESNTNHWAILGGWCTHVKVLKEVSRRIQLDETFARDYPAILLLQDHVILDKEWTEEVLRDWIANFPENWDMVQLDPWGEKLKKDYARDFRGKPVYRPSWKGGYFGIHATLMRTRSVPTILEKMQGLNVVPIDWITKAMNDQRTLDVFSWDARVATTAFKAGRALKDKWLPANNCEDAKTKGKGY